jgi:succinylglutamate desuccinylase
MLTVLDALPAKLLELEATQLHQVLDGPTLIHLKGQQEPPLFISVLLHGNENTGWLAVQTILRQYRDRPLPRSVSLLIGNVAAAREGKRHLDNQPDYNRIWLGGDSPEQRMAQQVIDLMRSRGVFASIDIHNNTGFNPHYGCVTKLDRRFLYLAQSFAPIVVYFTSPKSVQANAFANLCPSVTLECGQPGQAAGTDHVVSYLETCLRLQSFGELSLDRLHIFHTVAIVKVPNDVSFSFSSENTDICFDPNLDSLNFRELAIGTKFARTKSNPKPSDRLWLEAWDLEDRNVADRFFNFQDGEIRTKVPVMPSMLTLRTDIIRQDCLCYFMERFAYQETGL